MPPLEGGHKLISPHDRQNPEEYKLKKQIAQIVGELKIDEDLFDMAYDRELKHDCLIDLIVVDDRDLSGAQGTAPIYKKIRTEGAAI
jgi:hypothetical protein